MASPKSLNEGTRLVDFELDGKPDQAQDNTFSSQHLDCVIKPSGKVRALMKHQRKLRAQRAFGSDANQRKLQRRPRRHTAPESLDFMELRSVEVVMNQVRLKFVEGYYPSSIDSRSARSVESLSNVGVFNFPTKAFSASRILQIIVDSVSLSRMASLTSDNGALLRAFQLHCTALAAYRQAVVDASNSNETYDILLAIAQALHFSQHFSGIGNAYDSSTLHIRGLADMISSRGLNTMTTEGNRLTLQDYQHYANRYGLMLRKPIHRDLSEIWSKHDLGFEDPLSRLNQLAIQLPIMLEEADRLCESLSVPQSDFSRFASNAAAIIQRLKGQERSLQQFYEQTHPVDQEPPYRPMEVANVDVLREQMPAPLLYAFPCAFEFTSLLTALFHARFWACLLSIRSTMATVFSAVTLGNDRSSDSVTHRIRMQSVTECADELCQTIMFFMEHRNGWAGLIAVAGNLKFVYDWYQSIGDYTKLAWCWNIGQILKAKGICSPGLVV